MTMISNSKGITEVPMIKNKLQEYTQKRGLVLPAYRAINEGLDHAPEFRCTVFVDGVEFTSKSTFRRLRDAEQDAAKLAYECFLCNSQQIDAKPLLREDPKSNKSILYEYAWKNKLGIPSYTTRTSEEGSLPLYVSMVTLADKNFTGAGGKSKKDSEQLAALAALQSLLGTDSGAVINQMLSLKRKRFEALKRVKFTGTHEKKPRKASLKGPGGVSEVKSEIPQPLPLAPWSSTCTTINSRKLV